jgi:hypothetical protein
MTSIQSYFRGREEVEQALAAGATNAEARIVHSKLAILYGASAQREDVATLRSDRLDTSSLR